MRYFAMDRPDSMRMIFYSCSFSAGKHFLRARTTATEVMVKEISSALFSHPLVLITAVHLILFCWRSILVPLVQWAVGNVFDAKYRIVSGVDAGTKVSVNSGLTPTACLRPMGNMMDLPR